MLANLVTAEWHKLTGNKMLASFTVWVYPVGVAAFVAVMGILIGVTEMPGSGPFVTNEWTEAAMSPWGIILRFPGHVMSRLPVIAFMAIAFAGEYEWNTWKNIVPRQRRAALIVSKFMTLGLLICLSLAITSLLWASGRAIIAGVYDLEYGPAVTGSVVGEFAAAYLLEMGLAFLMALILSGLTAISVLLTRTIVGGLLLGFGLSVIEALAGLLFPLMAGLFDAPKLINGYAFAPGYAIDNVRSWVIEGERLIVPGMTVEHSLFASAGVLAVWVIGLIALTAVLFERQDLVS